MGTTDYIYKKKGGGNNKKEIKQYQTLLPTKFSTSSSNMELSRANKAISNSSYNDCLNTSIL